MLTDPIPALFEKACEVCPELIPYLTHDPVRNEWQYDGEAVSMDWCAYIRDACWLKLPGCWWNETKDGFAIYRNGVTSPGVKNIQRLGKKAPTLTEALLRAVIESNKRINS